MLSTCGLGVHIAIYTCIYADAVYLYLRTVNQTLAEGNLDYRDGRLIRNKTIGQRFAGKHLATIFLNAAKVARLLLEVQEIWANAHETRHSISLISFVRGFSWSISSIFQQKFTLSVRHSLK